MRTDDELIDILEDPDSNPAEIEKILADPTPGVLAWLQDNPLVAQGLYDTVHNFITEESFNKVFERTDDDLPHSPEDSTETPTNNRLLFEIATSSRVSNKLLADEAFQCNKRHDTVTSILYRQDNRSEECFEKLTSIQKSLDWHITSSGVIGVLQTVILFAILIAIS